MIGKKEYESINSLLSERFEEKEFLIAVHRGTWHGNIIENTYLSAKLAIAHHGDMVEFDLSNSTDGELYLFHDGGEKRVLGIERNIKTLSSKEIDQIICRNSLGEPSGKHLERFDDVLSRIDDDWLFNIDRSWWFLPSVDSIMQKHPNRIRQAIIKTHADDESLSFFSACPRKYMYMPIVSSIEEEEKALRAENINMVGMELIVTDLEDSLISRENIRMLREQGLYVWINTITLGTKEKHVLSAKLDDDASIESNPDDNWGFFLERGVNVLQTDWPLLMDEYRRRRSQG